MICDVVDDFECGGGVWCVCEDEFGCVSVDEDE